MCESDMVTLRRAEAQVQYRNCAESALTIHVYFTHCASARGRALRKNKVRLGIHLRREWDCTHLKDWAVQTKNFLLHARLITTASDAHAADIFYHTDCYTQLRYAASKVNCSADSTSHGHAPVFDPMVTAQLFLYMSESGKVFKRTHLESLYKDKLEELGRPCPDINATMFKDHLLSSLPTG